MALLLRSARLLALLALAATASAQAPCSNGSAGGFPCSNVDLMAHLPLATFVSPGSAAPSAGSSLWGWTDPLTGHEYALMGLTNGTAFVDVTDPAAPVYLGKLPTATTASSWRELKVYQNHAFIVSEAPGHGMQVFDLTRLRNVASPPVTFTADARYTGAGKAHTVTIDEATGFAYLNGANQAGFTCNGGGLHIVNVQNPTAPTFAGCYDGDGYTHDAQCLVYDGPDTDHTGRSICFAYNEDTVTIVDVTAPAAPVQVARATYPAPEYTHQGWLTDDRRYVLVDDELDGNASTPTRTLVMDVADLDDPGFAFAHSGPTNATDHNLYIRGPRAYQSNYAAGLRILDLSGIDAGSLQEVAYFDTYPASNAYGFNGQWSNYPYFESGVVVTSDLQGGLFVLAPGFGPPPSAGVDPAAVNVTVAPGGSTTVDVTIANTAGAGARSLVWSAALTFDDGRAPAPPAAPAVEPAPTGGPWAAAGEGSFGEAAMAAADAPKALADAAAGTGTASLGAGGPDSFGYAWIDSNEPGGPTYVWTDISVSGTAGPVGDDATAVRPIGFTFPFYGASHTNVTMGTNGVLSFSGTFPTGWWTNTGLPNAAQPNDLVAPFWDDLNVTGAAQTDTYQDNGGTPGDPSDDRFIAQWTAVPRFSGAGTYTFQAVLYPNGDVEYYYNAMTGAVNSSTVGIENAGGTVGLQVVFDAAYVTNNLAVRFYSPTIWASLAPANGVVAPGGSQVATLTLDATELEEGTYEATLNIATNDPAEPTVAIPITLTVGTEAPAIVVTEPVPFGINTPGTLLRVRWTSPPPATGGGTPGLVGPVAVTLHRTGGASQVLFASTADDGAQNWPIPAGFTPGPEFTVEVTNLADPAVTGLSHPFAIQTTANEIAVTEPNASGYAAGQQMRIRWTGPAGFPAGADTRIRLLCPGLEPRGVIGGTPNDGVHAWTVPADIAPAQDCRLDLAGKIVAHQGYFGRSPAFDLTDVPYPTLTVTAPAGGASWPRGSVQNVTWANGGSVIPGDIKVFLVRAGFPRVRLTTTPNDGVFAWSIPAGQAPASNYQIHVEGTYNGKKIKGAGANFTIAPALTAGSPSAVGLETGWTRVVWEGSGPVEASRWLGGLGAGGVTAVAVGARGALVADGAGRTDGLGAVSPGEAVEVWVSGAATLARSGEGGPAAGEVAAPGRYGAAADGYGASVLLVSAAGLADGDEVAAYDAAGALVGSGVARGGRVALVVRGSSADGRLASEETAVEVRAPLASGSALTLRRWAAGAGSEDATALTVTAARRLDVATEAASAAVAYADGSVWAVAVDAGAPAQAEGAPSAYALRAAVPNPSSGATTLRYDVPVASEVSVEVYDLLGRRVAVLVEGRVEAGAHAVRWDGSSSAAGVYVVRMRAGTFAAAQRLTIAR